MDPVRVATSRQSSTVTSVEQTYAVVPYRHKIGALSRVLATSDAEAASINHAKAGESGPAVATLPLPQGGDEVCTMVDKAVLAAIAREPAGYYVAVRTPSHPDGAIRGQLN